MPVTRADRSSPTWLVGNEQNRVYFHGVPSVKVLVLVFVVLLGVLQYRLWFGRGNLEEVARLEATKQEQQERNAQLAERNNSLAAEVHDLKQGLQAIEEKARSEMGMVRNGETFYQIIDSPAFVASPVEAE